jgi:lipopolysaccharide-induced tumor necrosis factor-alpha factor
VIFGSTPLQICCPNCQAIVITDTQYVYGTMVWLSVLILFLLGFWCFFWIPLVINDLKDVHHYCPNCKHRCGVYSRL